MIFKDQLNRSVDINYPPRRIISLVPSQTELLFDLGLNAEIIGITKFCVHPEAKVKALARVGGTKNLEVDFIRSLKPDLIIGNKEENEKQQIETLMRDFPVWMSDVSNLEEAMDCIAAIGAMVDRTPEAAYMNHLINAGFRDLQTLALQHGIDKKVAYLIWRNPYLFAGKDTFIDHVLSVNGLRNVVKDLRYPELTLAKLELLQPDIVFLSSEPYPFDERHLEEIRLALPATKIMLVDGEMFSWHGSRLIKAVQYHFQLQKEL
ncbi:helical backbone metal receptor [Pedobacter sp. MC2016-14]|uniref:helical backbone metal receptor n=1 Tax=Pedobacter sp. MC2016-14 TaxID=2897327 RepID=UPI00351D9F4D